MTDQPEPDEEPTPTEAEQAYNVASYELFQLAAYGHYTYAPLTDTSTGRYLTFDQIQAGTRDYNRRIQAAQERFEAAVLRKAAEEADRAGGIYASRGDSDRAGAAFALMETYLRMASEIDQVEAPQPATCQCIPASPMAPRIYADCCLPAASPTP